MSPLLVDLERKASRLSARDRELLAEHLIQSLDDAPLTEVEEAWVKEAERRFTAYRRDRSRGIPADRVFGKLRREFGWKK